MGDDPAAFGERVFQQMLELYVTPEVERRIADNMLTAPFELRAAQILLPPDGAPDVRLNSEVRAIVKIKPRGAMEAGQLIYEKDIEDVEGVELVDEDPNAAHIFILRYGSTFFLSFNFVYNRKRIEEHLEASREFLESARYALASMHRRAFCENLLASVELISKSFLLSLSDPRILRSKKHQYVFDRFNMIANSMPDWSEFSDAYKVLSRIRTNARYLNGSVDWSLLDFEGMLVAVDKQLQLSISRMQARAT